MQNKNNKKTNQTSHRGLLLAGLVAFWLVVYLIIPKSFYAGVLDGLFDKSHLSKIDQIAKSNAAAKAQQADAVAEESACASSLPKHSAAKRFQTIESKAQSRVYIVNAHVYPTLVTFIESESSTPFGAVLLMPEQDKQIKLPVGDYEIEAEVGTEWCNFSDGFDDGVLVSGNQRVNVLNDKVSNIKLSSFGDGVEDVMLSMTNTIGLAKHAGGNLKGSGTLVLQPVVGGNFSAEGSINGLPVNFLVDTGASLVTISSNFAQHAGIRTCHRKIQLSTANGITTGCLAKAHTLTVGQFTFKNIDVVYQEGVGSSFLLGMNVISQFKLEQHGDVMKLSR